LRIAYCVLFSIKKFDSGWREVIPDVDSKFPEKKVKLKTIRVFTFNNRPLSLCRMMIRFREEAVNIILNHVI